MDKVEGPEERDLLTATILVGKAKYVLAFLNDLRLIEALGEYAGRSVAQDIHDVLDDVLALGAATSVSEIRRAKVRLRKAAGLIRLVARMEMFLHLGARPEGFVEALRQYCRDAEFNTKSTVMPTNGTKFSHQTLEFRALTKNTTTEITSRGTRMSPTPF
jgi:hypothetical protein